MRTITENLFHRLTAQAQEAELQGFANIAESLTNQLEKHGLSVRADDEFYSYNKNDFEKDVITHVWGAIVRVADFYGIKRFDAQEIQELVEKTSQDLISSFCVKSGITHGVGYYEEQVPGEIMEKSFIEVDEEDV